MAASSAVTPVPTVTRAGAPTRERGSVGPSSAVARRTRTKWPDLGRVSMRPSFSSDR